MSPSDPFILAGKRPEFSVYAPAGILQLATQPANLIRQGTDLPVLLSEYRQQVSVFSLKLGNPILQLGDFGARAFLLLLALVCLVVSVGNSTNGNESGSYDNYRNEQRHVSLLHQWI